MLLPILKLLGLVNMGTKVCDTTKPSLMSNLNTPLSKKGNRSREFALLAMVGQRKREASAYQEAEEHYYTVATELHANLTGLLSLLQPLAERHAALRPLVAEHTSRLHSSTKSMLNFWSKNSSSQERVLSLLDCDGLKQMLASTPDGYVCLSTDLILENVARAIGATKEEIQSPSSDSTTTMQ